MVALFNRESTTRHFRSLVHTMGDQELNSSFICILHLRYTLALNLSKLSNKLNGEVRSAEHISYAVNDLSSKPKVSLSNNPVIFPKITCPHFSFAIMAHCLNILHVQ